MKYDDVLMPLLAWLRKHPNMTANQLARTIQSVPFPLRLDPEYPATECLVWKLRYLEACGLATSTNGKWKAA